MVEQEDSEKLLEKEEGQTEKPLIDEYQNIEKSEIPFYEKTEGTKKFKEQNYEEAIKHYSKALLAIKFLLKDNPEMQKDADKLTNEIITPCKLNLALCNMKIGNYTSAIKFADEVLQFDENNIKALYRRGFSHMKKYNFGEAKQDLLLAKELEPQDQQIQQAIKQLEKHLLQQKAREKYMSEQMLKGYERQESNQKSSIFQTIKTRILNCCQRRNASKKKD